MSGALTALGDEQSLSLFRELVDRAPDPIVVVDAAGLIALVNVGTEAAFGYPRDELVGAPVELLIPERFQGRHVRHRATYAADPRVRPMGSGLELSARRNDGSEFPVEISLSPVEAAGRSLVMATVRDSTERTQRDDEIRALNSELEAHVARLAELSRRSRALAAIVESSDDAIIGKTLDGTIVSWNRGAERLYGYRADEVIGRPVSILAPAPPEAELPAILSSIARGERVEHHETERVTKSGTTVSVSLSVSPIRDEDENIVGASTIARDVTARRRAERELRELKEQLEIHAEQLEAANRELEAFSYSVSHDLRAPLRAIDGFSRILLDTVAPQLDPAARRYLRLVGENAKAMGELIDGLLAFSRLGQQALAKRPVALEPLAREVLDELGPELDGRSVDVSLDALPALEADPTLLKQVLLNLLSNALKYTRTREPAQIDLGSYESDGERVVFVRDNGVGFDMRYADKLFHVFQRLHRAEDYEGTGLGLALVARIVKRHGGRIWAEGKVDEGATFYFTLEGGG